MISVLWWVFLGVIVGYQIPYVRLRYGRWKCHECGRLYRYKDSDATYNFVYCSQVCYKCDLHRTLAKQGFTDEEIVDYISTQVK